MSTGQQWWADQCEEYIELCNKLNIPSNERKWNNGVPDLKHLEELKERAYK